MNRLTLLVAVLLATGCEQMTNEEIVQATKLCEDAGMRAVMYENLPGTIEVIKCRPHPYKCSESP